jgi:hypothetical protein
MGDKAKGGGQLSLNYLVSQQTKTSGLYCTYVILGPIGDGILYPEQNDALLVVSP